MIKAELLTIGDEILFGQIVDTNSQWMSVELTKIGIRVVRKTSVSDTEEEILTAFQEAESRADIILITGGLGPTSDDLTKPCLARYFNCEIRINDEALKEVSEFFKSRGRELTELNRLQAALPVCCERISNPVGTAPGMWFNKDGKVFVSMPGVPHEMKRMMSNIVLPRLQRTFNPPVIAHKMIKTVGIGESFLADKIKDWEAALPAHIKLAYLPSQGMVKLRLTAYGTDRALLQSENEALAAKLVPLAGEYIFGYDEDELENTVGQMLISRRATLALAESCTGGYLGHVITSVPGCSAYFHGGIIAYDNEVKTKTLGVSPETLRTAGAVSEETVKEMAEAVRRKLNTTIGVATSGIAGPDGGTDEKPVGTVWIAYSDDTRTVAKKLQLGKDRMVNIRITAVAALNFIRTNLGA